LAEIRQEGWALAKWTPRKRGEECFVLLKVLDDRMEDPEGGNPITSTAHQRAHLDAHLLLCAGLRGAQEDSSPMGPWLTTYSYRPS
jgi:hypothetical protein